MFICMFIAFCSLKPMMHEEPSELWRITYGELRLQLTVNFLPKSGCCFCLYW